jgi:hypothetical protein
MCLIIDACVAHKFHEPPHEDVESVVSWLLNTKHVNRVVLGGKLKNELFQAGKAIRRFLAELLRRGRLLLVPDEKVNTEEKAVIKLLKQEKIDDADDPHILALARVSGSRLLISADSSSRLHELFKNRRFLKPPGKIYQDPSHEPLLWKARKCK